MEKKPTKDLILFDFDGTLTTKDTMLEFIRFVKGSFRLYLGFVCLSPVMIAYKMGFLANDRAKEILLAWHFKGLEKGKLEEHSMNFAVQAMPGLLRPAGMQQLKRYQADGHRVLMISASLDLWLQPWAKSQGIELLSTEAAWQSGHFSGRLANANCYGPEKVTRLRAHLDPTHYAKVIAYGDSGGDKEMLALADEAHFKPFRNQPTK